MASWITDLLDYTLEGITVTVILINLRLGRYGKGKIARKLGSDGMLVLYLGLFTMLFFAYVSPWGGRTSGQIAYGLLLLLLLGLDDFFNGGPPRKKKRLRKWLKNKLAKLKPAPVKLPYPQGA